VKTLWMEVHDLTGPPAEAFGFTFRLSEGESEVLIRCLICGARFPQDEPGNIAFKEHEFDLHERAIHYEWAELDGRQVTIRVIRRGARADSYREREQVELVAVEPDGTVYCLPFSYYDHSNGGFKFRPRAKTSRLLPPS